MDLLKRKKHRENFLVLHAGRDMVRGYSLELDGDRGLKFEKVFDKVSIKDLTRRRRVGVLRSPVILAVDPSQALTITVPLTLSREEGRKGVLLSATELENLLAQKMLATFHEHRASIGRVMGMEEFDVTLVDAKVKSFAIDGHSILTPVGFKGKNIEVLLELTFTTREIFEEWKDFFSSPDNFFFTEMARSELYALQRCGKPPTHLLFFESGHTNLFMLEKHTLGPLLYRSSIEWKITRIIAEITERYGVDADTGHELYSFYFEDKLSPFFGKNMKDVFQEALQSFDTSIHGKPLRGKIYVESSSVLPLRLPLKLGRVTLEEAPLALLLKNLHLHLHCVKDKAPFKKHELFHALAPFVEFYYDRGDTSVNRALKRRLHWLIT